MKTIDRTVFLDKSKCALEQMLAAIEELKPVRLAGFEPSKSAFIILDLVNGFLREGALKSERIESVVEPTVDLVRMCGDRGIPIVVFSDCHSGHAVEFESYPPHCIKGTSEAELIEEVAGKGEYVLIPKNSTNGFLEEGFRTWLDEHKGVTDFILAGDCTDICVMQFALTLKAYFNSKDIKSRLVVPVNAVETYDLGNHYGDLLNVMSLQIMGWNGIELASAIV